MYNVLGECGDCKGARRISAQTSAASEKALVKSTFPHVASLLEGALF